MRLKLQFARPGQDATPLSVTAEPTTAIGDIATALYRNDPMRDGSAPTVPLTVHVHDAGASAPRLVPPGVTLAESGMRSGCAIELVQVDDRFATAAESRGPAVAVLRVSAGPDAGREFPLPSGASVVGRDRDVDVRLGDPMVSKRHLRVNVADTVEVIDLGSANGILVAGAQVQRAVVTSADEIVIGDDVLVIVPLGRVTGTTPTTPVIDFVRSPRVVPQFTGEKFVGPTPPKPPQPMRLPYLAILAPLILGGVMLLATHQLIMVAMMGLSPVLAVGAYFDNRSTAKRMLRKETARFQHALDVVRQELADAQTEERAVRMQETPSTFEVLEAVLRLGPLLWTNRPEGGGFLTARLGIGTARSRSELQVPGENDCEPEHWAALQRLAASFTTIDSVPIVADWRSAGAVGVSGPRERVLPVARGIMLQLAGMHSPAEFAVAAFTSGTTRSDWEWLLWLPHTSSPHSPLTGPHLADASGSGMSLLSRLEGVVDARSSEPPKRRPVVDSQHRGDRDAPVVPAVLVVVEDDSPIDHARLVRLAERGADVGVHVLWIAPAQQLLPAVCRTFLALEDGPTNAGQVRLGETTLPVEVEPLAAEDARAAALALAPVVDAGAPVDDASDLPRSVSYPSLVGVGLLDDAGAVLERWQQSHSMIDRNAPPVKRAKEGMLRAIVGHGAADPFSLDLRSQGPHALVGGTTGAGKSEFLQAWVLGLASAYSPDRVTFLFVDYKGGSAFADCVHLPHTVGLVTDLSPHLVRRALTSLRAELRFREHLLQRKRAKDLVSLERAGDHETPPSLIIIVDEFAALAQEVPEFVDGVVDVAQRGRSLGLHLILATQRPAGVIKDNLRANTNLRIALRMADADDSADILGDPMAAHFDPSIPGRAAAKTGPGRLALFQAGYAGGRTSDTPPPPVIELGELAFGEAPAWETPDDGAQAPVESGPTDISRIVDTVSRAARGAHIPVPRKPWLDALAAVYDFSRLPNPRSDARLLLGVRDDPAAQAQPTEFYEPDRDGNMVIFGAGGSGKSTALRTIAVAAAVTPRGGPMRVYGLDFGAHGLRMLEGLPHVGSIVAGDDDERVVRLIRMLRDTVDERSTRYAAVQAGSIGEYRTLAGRPDEPRILLLIDGIGAFREAYEFASASTWFTAFAQIAADGRQVGVHLVMTGDRPNALPPSIASTVQCRVVLRLASEDDYVMLGVPKDVLGPASPPGRALFGGDELQIAVLGADSNVAVQGRELGRLADSMRRQGIPAAPAVERLADRIGLGQLPVGSPGSPVIGVADDTLAPAVIDAHGAFMLSGSPGSGRTTALATIARALVAASPQSSMVLYSPRATQLASTVRWSSCRSSPEDTAADAERLRTEILAGRPPAGIFVENLPDFTGTDAEFALDQLVREAVRAGVFVLGEGESSTWSQAYTLAQPFKAARRGLVLAPSDMDGDTLYGTSLGRVRRADFPPGRGFVIQSGRAAKVQVAVPDAR